MIWTQAKAMAVLAAVSTSAQSLLARLSEQVAAWVPAPTTTTSISGSPPQIGSPPIGGGPGIPGAGTMIISWSTQHFTVTTGIPDGSSLGYGGGGTVTDGGGIVMPVPTGVPPGSSQQASGAGDPASGGGTSGFPGDADSQTEGILSNYGATVPPILTESLGPPGAPVSGNTAGGTVTGGFPAAGSPQPGSTVTDEDEVFGSILAGSLDFPQATVSGASAGGTVADGSFGGGSQPGSIVNGGGMASVLTGSQGPPQASVLGATAGGTITDGLSGGGPRPSSVADDEVMASILSGNPDNPGQASGSGDPTGGTVTDRLSGGGSQPGPTTADEDGAMASILAGSPDNPQQASVPGDIASGTLTDGLPNGSPQPESTIADSGDMASILAGGPDNSQQASVLEPISDGGIVAPGTPRSSQPEPEPITDGGGNRPPTVPTGGSQAASEALVSGATSPSESAVPSSDSFVIQLGPAGAVAAVASASNRPLGRRQDKDDDHYLMNAGTERSGDCSQATQFEIVDGELTRGGQKVSTNPGTGGAAQQRLAVNPVVGLITRSWEIVDGELLWLNDSFVGGRAGFCEDDDTRTVFFTTRGEGGEPVGCTPMHLTPMFVADCPGLNPDGSRRDLLPAEETLILPPGIYFPAMEPKGQACKVTTEYWTVGQFTLAPAPTGLSRRP